MPYSPVRVLAFAVLAVLLIVATMSPMVFLEILVRGGLLGGGVALALAVRPSAAESTIT